MCLIVFGFFFSKSLLHCTVKSLEDGFGVLKILYSKEINWHCMQCSKVTFILKIIVWGSKQSPHWYQISLIRHFWHLKPHMCNRYPWTNYNLFNLRKYHFGTNNECSLNQERIIKKFNLKLSNLMYLERAKKERMRN